MNFEDLMTVDEVAALLKVPKSWVYDRSRLQGRDQIPHLKLGKYLRFEESAIREWLRKLAEA